MKNIISFLGGFKKGTEDFGKNISIIINSFLLTIVYFIGVGLSFIISKIFNKHFLDLKTENNVTSYWKELNLSKRPLEEYLRQF